MKLYIYEGMVIGQNREDFVRKAAVDFLKEKGDIAYERAYAFEIERTEHGKPYFKEPGAPHFSVSDSGQLWTCAVSDDNVGLDIQEVKDKDYLALAKRFFTEEEAAFVELWGQEGFFLLWVRKEAFVKHKGTGLKEGLSSFSVIKNGGIQHWIEVDGEKYFFADVDFGPTILCAVCSAMPDTVEVRLL